MPARGCETWVLRRTAIRSYFASGRICGGKQLVAGKCCMENKHYTCSKTLSMQILGQLFVRLLPPATVYIYATQCLQPEFYHHRQFTVHISIANLEICIILATIPFPKYTCVDDQHQTTMYQLSRIHAHIR